MIVRSTLLAAGLAALAACAPERKAPVDVVVLAYDGVAHRYEPRTVKLQTVTDLVAMEGPVARLVGGAKFVIDPADPALLRATTAEQALAAITKDEGHPVHVSYIENEQGVLVPADFHSLNIVTTYYNFERAFDFYKRVGGLTTEEFGTPPVYYFAEFVQGQAEPEKDNAMFFTLTQGFMILPFEALQQVPLAINSGVVGHEYTHAVFSYRVFGKALLPQIFIDWADAPSTPGLNLLASLDEGLADVLGTGITCTDDFTTCDESFFSHSLPDEFSLDREIDRVHCLDATLRANLAEMDSIEFRGNGLQYEVGSALSSALWRAAGDDALDQKLGAVIGAQGDAAAVKLAGLGEARKRMFHALYAFLAGGRNGAGGLRELIESVPEQAELRLESTTRKGVLDLMLDATDDADLRLAMCRAFLDHFRLTLSDLKSCPAGATSYGNCSQ